MTDDEFDAPSIAAQLPTGWPRASISDSCLGWILDYKFLEKVEQLAKSRTEYSTSMEATEQVLIAALEVLAAATKAAPAAQGDALDRGVREELSIGKAINRAARDLPEGWEIRIDLERHAGVVFLIDPNGNETMSEGGELFSDQINAAIDAARAAKEGEPQ